MILYLLISLLYENTVIEKQKCVLSSSCLTLLRVVPQCELCAE